jgi:hypothetical protein
LSEDPVKTARQMRAGAARVRGGAAALEARAEELPRSFQRRLLKLEAEILRDGAATMETRALEVEPAKGSA